MFEIAYAPEARRALRTAPADSRQLIVQLVHAVAEVARLVPARAEGVLGRLGRVLANGEVEVDVEDHTVRVAIDPQRQLVRLLAVTEQGTAVKRKRSSLVPPEYRMARRPKLRA